MSDFRVAVVGLGGISDVWLPLLRERPDVEIVAAVDVDTAAAEAALARHGLEVPLFDGVDAALGATSPSVVVNLTPPQLHRAVGEAALGAGCHVLSEKPLAPTIQDARALVDAAERARRSYAVMQNRRFEVGIRVARNGIAAGRIGKVTITACDFLLAPRFGGFREEMENPLLLDMAIHHFDQARFLTGADAVAVSCHAFNPAGSPFAGDASAICVFEFDDGSVFSYRGSWSAPGTGTSWNGAWRIIGTAGTVSWDGEGAAVAEIALPSDGELVAPADREEWDEAWEGRTGHAGCLDELFGALVEGRRAETDCADNVKSVEMVVAAVESTRRGGERVTLAELSEAFGA